MRQKRAWKAFALKKKLRYTQSKFLASPEMSGVLDDYTSTFFTAEHQPPDGRNSRKMTALEISLSSRIPFEGGIASGGMVPLIRTIAFKEEFIPPMPDWDKEWIACADNRNGIEAYLTPERLKALTGLMKIKNAWIILLFRKDVTLLRIDTADPLDSVDKLEKLSKFMVKSARALELTPGEDGRLKASLKEPVRRTTVKVAAPSDDISLQLEDVSSPAKPDEQSGEQSE